MDIHVDDDMFTGGSESESEEGDSTDGEITSMNNSHDGMSMDEEGVDIPSGNGRHGNERKELLRNDPEVQELLKEMLKEKRKKKKRTLKKSKRNRRLRTRTRSRTRSRSRPTRGDRRRESSGTRSRSQSRSQPRRDDKRNDLPGNNRNLRGQIIKDKGFIKSPSDTTLYSPVLKKGVVRNNLIDKISDFVENIRISDREKEHEREHRSKRERSSHRENRYDDKERGRRSRDNPTSPEGHRHRDYRSRSPETSMTMQKERDVHDGEAARIILEAEKFCANVNAPKGNDLNALDFGIDQQKELENLRINDSDDNFFHVTCHVKPGLKAKIERGEFIDLERLLTKDTNFKVYDEKRIELVSRGGNTFFTPVSDREAKINGIRKWEQAFRIYAAIYTRANPHCASEVWEYVYVINTAASSFHWDNVDFYDSTFRQLMSQKPWRSWAKTYVQGWNLAMRDPIVKSQGNACGNAKGRRDLRDDCCWCFNKNRCREGLNCHFDHRCTYCGGWGHGYFNCRKRKKSSGGSGSGYGNGNNYQQHKNNGEDSSHHRHSGSPRESSKVREVKKLVGATSCTRN